jgi:hypothetical protein
LSATFADLFADRGTSYNALVLLHYFQLDAPGAADHWRRPAGQAPEGLLLGEIASPLAQPRPSEPLKSFSKRNRWLLASA